MPELPEVETVRRGIAPAMEGRRILRAEIRREGLRWPFPAGLAGRLEGRQVLQLARRSKYILIGLDSGETAILHLGMSGRITLSGLEAAHVPGKFHHDHPPLEKHDHVLLDMEGGARVTLNDARRFGALDLAPSAALEAHPLLAKLGPEPLANAFHAGVLAAAAEGRKTPVKSFLLDQAVVAGLGNIYVCEVLHRTGIHPARPALALTGAECEQLVQAIREVLGEAIEAGGSSLRDYRQADGSLGYFQHGFRVYDREGQPCLRPGCGGVIARISQSGRSSWFCPACQF